MSERKIEIKSVEESLNEFRDYWKKIENGEKVEKKEAVYFESRTALKNAVASGQFEKLVLFGDEVRENLNLKEGDIERAVEEVRKAKGDKPQP